MANPKRLVMHALHPHIPNNGKFSHTTRCWRSVEPSRIAAFDEGVTCKVCISRMDGKTEEASNG